MFHGGIYCSDGELTLRDSAQLLSLSSPNFVLHKPSVFSNVSPPLPLRKIWSPATAIMWLLNTARAELHYFVSPEQVPRPGFAILSHVWTTREQTFQEVQSINHRCKRSGENSRDYVCEKIRRCCELAEAEGHEWVWIDTCCIDKTSSAELSEAINSMFRYYALSRVCYVHLKDVRDISDFGHVLESRREIRWATRGWTLQELIAPSVVVLLSSTWTLLGSKHDLAETLEQLTRVPVSLLRHDTHLSDYSIAQRMSWAAGRETTRAEDEAYCLLGICDIAMPTLYGEGRRAFRRLQEEIMRRHPDTSLFAWGVITDSEPLVESRIAIRTTVLLADSPRDFMDCGDIVYTPGRSFEKTSFPQGPRDRTSFSPTAHGILARVPLLVVNEGMGLIDLSCSGRLPNLPTPGATPLFLAVLIPSDSSIYPIVRTTRTDKRERLFSCTAERHLASSKMTELYLQASHELSLHFPSRTSISWTPSTFLCNRSFRAPFHFCPRNETIPRIHAVESVGADWTGSPPAQVYLEGSSLFSAYFGICTARATTPHPQAPLSSSSSIIHWARVAYRGFSTASHDCSKDHISEWPGYQQRFPVPGFDARKCFVRLAFTRSTLNPDTLILNAVQYEPHTRIVPPEP